MGTILIRFLLIALLIQIAFGGEKISFSLFFEFNRVRNSNFSTDFHLINFVLFNQVY